MYQNKPVSILLLCISPLLLAEPMVIHDSGNTTPLQSIPKNRKKPGSGLSMQHLPSDFDLIGLQFDQI